MVAMSNFQMVEAIIGTAVRIGFIFALGFGVGLNWPRK